MKNKLILLMKMKKIICHHKDSDIICWHWTHGYNGMDYRHIEIQLKCNRCGKIYYRYIKDREECNVFAKENIDKIWSNKCKPIL